MCECGRGCLGRLVHCCVRLAWVAYAGCVCCAANGSGAAAAGRAASSVRACAAYQMAVHTYIHTTYIHTYIRSSPRTAPLFDVPSSVGPRCRRRQHSADLSAITAVTQRCTAAGRHGERERERDDDSTAGPTPASRHFAHSLATTRSRSARFVTAASRRRKCRLGFSSCYTLCPSPALLIHCTPLHSTALHATPAALSDCVLHLCLAFVQTEATDRAGECCRSVGVSQ